MEIKHIDGAQRQEDLKKPSKPAIEGAGTFEALLAEQLDQASLKTPSPSDLIGNKAGIDPALAAALSSAETSKEPNVASLDEIFAEQAASLLGEFQSYSSALKQGASSREAWDMLADIETQALSMEESFGQSGQADQRLQSVLEEVKILTSVEKIKVNRGDYL